MVKYTSPYNRKPTSQQLAQINAFKNRKAAAFGGDYQKYLESKRPPLSPTNAALRSLERSSVGDKDYERDLIINDKYLQQADKKFWLENDSWFNPDGSRKYSDPEDQAAWDRMNGRKYSVPKTTVQEKTVQNTAVTPPEITAFQLPTMMAPMPGQRHMLFNGRGFNNMGSDNRSAFMATGFSHPISNNAPENQNQGQNDITSATGQSNGIPMPSNLNRFYALQAGAQQTPYAHLITDHVLRTNVKRGNPADLNTPIHPYPFAGSGYGVAQPTSFSSPFNPVKYGNTSFGSVPWGKFPSNV